jgi:uncharacterized protein YbaP (TraB family)
MVRRYADPMPRALCAVSLAAILSTLSGSAQTPTKTMLWTVRGGEGPPTYLAGSVHVLAKEYYPLSDVWNRAFESSSVLIEEIDLAEMEDPATAMGLLSRGMLSDGRTLKDVIPGDLYTKVLARAETLGMPELALERMKPWVVALSFAAPELRRSGFDPMLGIDRHFFERAREAGKERRALETASFQLDRLDRLSMPLQTAMLKSALDELDTEADNIHTIAEAWKTGNVVTLERLLLAALLESPELYKTLLVDRNRSWVEPIETCLTRKTSCFVVVGAAHLVGPHSVVEMLRERGYKVEQQ